MNILHLDSSILGDASASRVLSAAIVAALLDTAPDATVVQRDLAADPIPHLDGAIAAGFRPLGGGTADVATLAEHARSEVLVGELLASAAGSLKDLAEARGAELELARLRQDAIAAVEPELADRLLYRLASVVIDRAKSAERIRLSVDQSGERWRISITRPMALRESAGALLSDAAPPDDDNAEQAASLQLRLVRGLARVAGGDLVTTATALALVLPGARGA